MDAQREKQIAEAEELLSDRKPHFGFAKGLFFGRFLGDELQPYPDLAANPKANRMLDDLREFCRAGIDPAAIDRHAEIPRSVVDGLAQRGVLGACVPESAGGRGLSQTSYCRLIEVLGGHCGGTALFVNAHHSIGPRALVLFGTPQQQTRWLPKLASGEWISAFALTEPEAGSDAGNVQTTATPTADGTGYFLNGQKRWITNGSLAQVLTVMARTPSPGAHGKPGESKITAFIVTPDMPGFQVVEPRMEKCGVRGTATSRLAFNNMFVPKENILGQLGKGLKVALTVLDFGRTTFGASCTGAAKFCVQHAVAHAAKRVQFGQTLSSFDLVQEKIAYMAAGTFAMEAMTYQTAALIDSGVGDYMLETAMLKVFATDTLWRIVNDTIQIYGGKAYFTDEPFERMMRDARINMIGEGANDVLRAFTALVGMREAGLELKHVYDAFLHPFSFDSLKRLSGFAGQQLEGLFTSPTVRVHHSALEPEAAALGKLIGQFGGQVQKLLRVHREEIVDRQYQLGRVADVAIELYAGACTLSRLDYLAGLSDRSDSDHRRDLILGQTFLRMSARRIRTFLASLWDNDDADLSAAAKAVLP